MLDVGLTIAEAGLKLECHFIKLARLTMATVPAFQKEILEAVETIPSWQKMTEAERKQESEALARKAMHRMIALMRQDYDIVTAERSAIREILLPLAT